MAPVQWLKKGVEAAKALQKEEAEKQAKAEQSKRMYRFFLAEDEECQITFVDGNLTPEGVLDIMTYREHRIFMNGSWNNFFVCTQDVEPCPICETGDDPSIVGVLTVIDHRTIKSKKDQTKVYKDQPRLFAAKRDTIKLLQKIAVKRGGLAGCKFDVTRTGQKSAAVGTQFDFVDKTPIADLKKKYMGKDKDGKPVTLFVPANYEHEIVFRSAKELRELGFGGQSIGSADKSDASDATGEEDYASKM